MRIGKALSALELYGGYYHDISFLGFDQSCEISLAIYITVHILHACTYVHIFHAEVDFWVHMTQNVIQCTAEAQ